MHDAVTCGRAGAGEWHAFSVARMPVLGCRGAHADLTWATVFVCERNEKCHDIVIRRKLSCIWTVPRNRFITSTCC